MYQHRYGAPSHVNTMSTNSATSSKSKANPIAKFFQRISSTKSPPPAITTQSAECGSRSVPAPFPSPPFHFTPVPSYHPPSLQPTHYQPLVAAVSPSPSSIASSMSMHKSSGHSGSDSASITTHSISSSSTLDVASSPTTAPAPIEPPTHNASSPTDQPPPHHHIWHDASTESNGSQNIRISGGHSRADHASSWNVTTEAFKYQAPISHIGQVLAVTFECDNLGPVCHRREREPPTTTQPL